MLGGVGLSSQIAALSSAMTAAVSALRFISASTATGIMPGRPGGCVPVRCVAVTDDGVGVAVLGVAPAAGVSVDSIV